MVILDHSEAQHGCLQAEGFLISLSASANVFVVQTTSDAHRLLKFQGEILSALYTPSLFLTKVLYTTELATFCLPFPQVRRLYLGVRTVPSTLWTHSEYSKLAILHPYAASDCPPELELKHVDFDDVFATLQSPASSVGLGPTASSTSSNGKKGRKTAAIETWQKVEKKGKGSLASLPTVCSCLTGGLTSSGSPDGSDFPKIDVSKQLSKQAHPPCNQYCEFLATL
jgi:hypothetical protein